MEGKEREVPMWMIKTPEVMSRWQGAVPCLLVLAGSYNGYEGHCDLWSKWWHLTGVFISQQAKGNVGTPWSSPCAWLLSIAYHSKMMVLRQPAPLTQVPLEFMLLPVNTIHAVNNCYMLLKIVTRLPWENSGVLIIYVGASCSFPSTSILHYALLLLHSLLLVHVVGIV